jgi:signal transduction histidine kinase
MSKSYFLLGHRMTIVIAIFTAIPWTISKYFTELNIFESFVLIPGNSLLDPRNSLKFIFFTLVIYTAASTFNFMFTSMIVAEEKSRQRAEELSQQVESLAATLERTRIAREIHDSLGHSLTVFGIHLEGALRLLQSNPVQSTELLVEAKQLNTSTLQELRESVTALRTDPLQAKTLPAAITELITEFQKSTGVVSTFDNYLKSSLSYELNVATYRIVQESLTNIRKYAMATEVTIALIQSATELIITITDNGNGFDLTQNTTGFGLQGMQERALALMGQLKIVTAPNQGCCVMATFPLSQQIDDDTL